MHTTLKYCREGVNADRRKKVLEAIPPSVIDAIPSIKPADWYPLDYYIPMLDAIAGSSGGNEAVAREDLVGCGRFSANEATNTFLRLFMKVLTPNLFANKLPSLFARDFNRGKVHVTASADRLVCNISQCKGHPHLGCTALGWATFALEGMGKSLKSSTLRGWSLEAPDSDEVEFELVWWR